MLYEDKSLIEEVEPYRHLLTGKVLNAGCGKRYIDLGPNSVRLDLNPDFAVVCDVIADVHLLPFKNDSFNSVLSVAVLEHTRFAWEVAKEFYRVLVPGGIAVAAIPFMQPRHGAPNDYVRFTDTGIAALMEWAGFKIVRVDGVHPTGFTIEWILREIVAERPMLRRLFWPVRKFVFPMLKNGKLMKTPATNLRSAYYVVAEK